MPSTVSSSPQQQHLRPSAEMSDFGGSNGGGIPGDDHGDTPPQAGYDSHDEVDCKEYTVSVHVSTAILFSPAILMHPGSIGRTAWGVMVGCTALGRHRPHGTPVQAKRDVLIAPRDRVDHSKSDETFPR